MTLKHDVFAVVLAVVVAASACSNREQPAPADSVTSVFRPQADSIASSMAKELAANNTRTGTLTIGDSAATWTARMRGDQPGIIEERVTVAQHGTIVRAFFFDDAGAIEQISEQRTIAQPGQKKDSVPVVETIVHFEHGAPKASRTVDGHNSLVTDNDLQALIKHTSLLVSAARSAPALPRTP